MPITVDMWCTGKKLSNVINLWEDIDNETFFYFYLKYIIPAIRNVIKELITKTYIVMKRNYIQPQMQSVNIASQAILSGSDIIGISVSESDADGNLQTLVKRGDLFDEEDLDDCCDATGFTSLW